MTEKQPTPVDLTVTDCDAAVETAPRTAVSEEGGSGGPTRVRTREAAPSLKRTWALLIGDAPSLWSEAPATPAELLRYAARGEWCSSVSVGARFAGRAYCALVAIPVSIAAYFLAYCAQRPGRLLALGLLITVAIVFA